MELNKLSLEFINSYSNPNTQRAYSFAVNHYLKWLKRKKVFTTKNLGIFHFNEYSSHLIKSNIRLISAKLKLHMIFSFYKYLYQMDYLEEKYLKRLAIPKKAPIRETPGLSDLEASKFLNGDFSLCETDFVAARDRLIIHIFLYLGLRIDEVTNINLDDCYFDKSGISTIFIKGKGGSGSIMVIKKEIIPVFENYLKLRKKRFDKNKVSLNKEKALLITSKGEIKRLTLIQIRWLIKNRRVKFGFKKRITPHWFRVTAISHLSEKTGIRSAFNFARHRSIETTEGYDRRRINLINHPAQFIDYANSIS